MKSNVFVMETNGGLEVVKSMCDNFFIGASKKTKIHKGMVDNKKIVYSFIHSKNSGCPFCKKQNLGLAGFDLAIIYIKSTSLVDIGVFGGDGALCRLLGDNFSVSGFEYDIILKIRSFTPSNERYIQDRVDGLGLSGTKYEKIIKDYFLNFSTRESMSLSLSAHRTTISRAIRKITDVCRVCGY